MKGRIPKLLLGVIFCMGAGLKAQVWTDPSPTLTAESYFGNNNIYPEYIRFKTPVPVENAEGFLLKYFSLSPDHSFRKINEITDELNMRHSRYQLGFRGSDILGAVIILHESAAGIQSLNGKLFAVPKALKNITAETAIDTALNAVQAILYKWQIPEEELFLKAEKKDENASYFPRPELIYIPKKLNFSESEFVLVYRMQVYAQEPISLENIYVNAHTGKIEARENLIHPTTVTGTAVTAYSGNRSINTDSTAPGAYRLRESSRSGVETYNMKTGSSYGAAVDFTDADNYWNNNNPARDHCATDAHWGAEMTYDFFKSNFNRNSYNNSGAVIKSYVHYGVNYANAFWDGLRMTYGDGNTGSILNVPLTSLDVCGHEIAHAVTTYSAGLIYSYESGQLNESFSDIFGNAIEYWARPSKHKWLIGEDITKLNSGIRNMANPNVFGHPKYYKGLSWYYGSGDNGGVHLNSGVQNYWYYLLSEGGKGKNEKNLDYNVDSLGFMTAAKIAYRNLTVYLTPSSNYADARYYAIKSATDLFGNCSKEVIATTNAWYTCGVGNKYDSGYVKADFLADTVICNISKAVQFYNRSDNAKGSEWWFGDSDTSQSTDPKHTYKNYGHFTIKLKVKSCFLNKYDSMVRTAYVKVDSTFDICDAVIMPNSGTDSTGKCVGFIYDDGGEGIYKQARTTYLKVGVAAADSFHVQFLDFDYEVGYDSLILYKGKPVAANRISGHTGTALPYAGKKITIIGNYFSLRHFSDPFVTGRGFKIKYEAFRKPLKVSFPVADTLLCLGDTLDLIPTASGGLNSNYDFTWEGGGSGFVKRVSPTVKTSYKVYLMDVCTRKKDSASISVTPRAPLNIVLISDTTICMGRSVQLNAMASGGLGKNYQYSWTPALPNQAAHTVTPTDTTVYSVVLTDQCTLRPDTAQITIQVRPALDVQLQMPDTLLCVGQSLDFKAKGFGGLITGYNYTWNFTASKSPDQNYAPVLTGYVKLTLSDACTVLPARDSVLVSLRAPLKMQLNNDSLLCNGRSIQLLPVVSGGKTSAITYSWNMGLSGVASHVVTPQVNSKYILSVSDACSAPVKDSISVNLMGPLKLQNIPDTLICYGSSVPVNAIATGGKSSAYSYSWNNGLPPVAAQSLAPLTLQNYRVILSDGCTIKNDTQDFVVDVRAPLQVNITSDKSYICLGDSATLTLSISGGLAAKGWNLNGLATTQTKFRVSPAADQNYGVALGDNCSNSASAVLMLAVKPLPVPDFMGDRTDICAGQTVNFTALGSGASAHTWYFHNGDSASGNTAAFIYPLAGNYDVKLLGITSFGCSSLITKPAYIKAQAMPKADFSYTPGIAYLNDPSFSFMDISTNSVGNTWNMGDGNSYTDNASFSHKYTDTGWYDIQLEVRNSLGCTDTKTVRLRVEDIYAFYIPSTFTPNADMKNDVYAPAGRGIKSWDLRIYDRWGGKVFENEGKSLGWNGKLADGKNASQGYYAVHLEVIDIFGARHVYRQVALLIK